MTIFDAKRILIGSAAVAVLASGGAMLLLGGVPTSSTSPATPAFSHAETSSPDDWIPARPGFPWSFPRDHWYHPGYRTEWWYFTGHLQSEADPSRWLGYQFTFFRVGLLPEAPDWRSDWTTGNLIMGHASISDLETGRHVFSDVLWRAMPLLGEFHEFPGADTGDAPREDATETTGEIAWCRAPAGTDGVWRLAWNGTGFDVSMVDERQGMELRLATEPRKPRIFQGPGGFSRKGDTPSAASLYYSFTRLHTDGEVRIGNERFRITGTSWMDKEFGSNQLTEAQVGWDWFSLQLEDGREVMLYRLRRRDGSTDFARGTFIDATGNARYLGPEDWSVEALSTWTSPRTGAEYPSDWRIRVPGESLDLRVRPFLEAQENVSEKAGGLHYWEGAVEITTLDGTSAGRGYVELTGYGDGNRPPI